MNSTVTLATDYKCLAPSGFHGGFPLRVAKLIEIPNNVDLQQIELLFATQLTLSGIQALSDRAFPVVLPPSIDDVGSLPAFAVGYLDWTDTLSPLLCFVGNRPCLPVLIALPGFPADRKSTRLNSSH